MSFEFKPQTKATLTVDKPRPAFTSIDTGFRDADGLPILINWLPPSVAQYIVDALNNQLYSRVGPPRTPTKAMIDAAMMMHVELVTHCRRGPDYPEVWIAMWDTWNRADDRFSTGVGK